MKKLFFNRYGSWGNILLLIVAGFFVIIQKVSIFYEPLRDLSENVPYFGFVLLLLFFGKMFVFRYYVGWNKSGMSIKVGSFKVKSFVFKQVTEIFYHENFLTIEKKSGPPLKFDLSGVHPEDVKKLLHILDQNCNHKVSIYS